MRDLYLISTFRHAWNRAFNVRIAAELDTLGFHCYCAHRDTDQTASPREIFEQDLTGLNGCRIVLAIAENESPNWGAEVGYAFARGMPIVGLARIGHEIPLILDGMMSEVLRVPDLDDVTTYLPDLARTLSRHPPTSPP